LDRIRAEVGWPPLAAPIGQILASQALLNVLSAARYLTIVDEVRALVSGRFGTPPEPIDPAVVRAVELTHDPDTAEDATPSLSDLRAGAEGVAASEEELLLLGLFDEDGMRVSVRSTPDLPLGAPVGEAPLALPEPAAAPVPRPSNGLVRVESPMVATFYRAPEPGAPPFVEEGDVVAAGQTLCILEAMKLMNEVKSEIEGVVRRIHVDNAQPVEYEQLLFELEPLAGRPLDGV